MYFLLNLSLLGIFLLVVDVKVPILQKRNDVTIFKMLTDFETQPVLFIPDIHFSTFQRHVSTHHRHKTPSSTMQDSPEFSDLEPWPSYSHVPFIASSVVHKYLVNFRSLPLISQLGRGDLLAQLAQTDSSGFQPL